MNYNNYEESIFNDFDIININNRALSDTPVGQRPTLRQGDSGSWVEELQKELTQLTFYSGPIDGSFGPSTNTAVRAFQTNNKLNVDGVVGRNTWSALIFLYAPLAICGGSGSLPEPFKGIVIDAGHGGTDPGASGNNIVEKDLTLAISMYMNDRFYELNIPHCMTRTTDTTLDQTDRINKIKSCFGDTKGVLLISNHINAGGGEGAEVIYALRNSSKWPTMILNEIGLAGQVTRKVYQRALPDDPTKDYYYLMRNTTNIQPVIVEYGFLDNEADANRLRFNWMRYAEATVKATCEYIGYPYRPPYAEEIIYIVQAGDTLFSIANKFQTTVDAIKSLNNLTSTSISVGQRLKIPFSTSEPGTKVHIVVAGDTLFSIANRYGTTVAELKRINNLTSDALSIGQTLLVPTGGETTPPVTPPAPETFTYVVVAGDTLFSIANKFGTTVAELKRINNLTSDALSIGQQLQIPLGSIVNRPVLRRGDRGEDVRDLQRLLYSLGYYTGDIDGSFGAATETAVKNFQSSNNLTPDGVVGPATWNALYRGGNPAKIVYTVVAGDTLYSIAVRFNTTANAIINANNLTTTVLTIGQQLLIPVSSGATSFINNFNQETSPIDYQQMVKKYPEYVGDLSKFETGNGTYQSIEYPNNYNSNNNSDLYSYSNNFQEIFINNYIDTTFPENDNSKYY